MRAQIRLWRTLLAACWTRFRLRTVVVLALLLVEVVAFAAAGLGLRAVVDGAGHDHGTAVLLGALVAGFAYAATHTLGRVRTNMRIHLVERIGLVEVDADILSITAGIETTDHLERSDYLDRVTLARGKGWSIVDSAWAAVETVSHVAQVLISLVLLTAISPWLALLVPFAAVPFGLNRIGQRLAARAETAAAEPLRTRRHLFDITTRSAPAKEIRVCGAGPELVRRHTTAWREATRLRFKARLTAAVFSAAGWGVFTVAYVIGLGFVAHLVVTGRGTPGDAVLAITLATQLRSQVETLVGRTGQVLDSSRAIEPYLWLRDYADARARAVPGRAPETIEHGITLRGVTYTYPGSDHPAVRDVSVVLPAGSVVAIVGEFGSGKTTLVKLLAKMHHPDDGQVLVDGTDLAGIDARSWRSRMAAGFQDFGRYQTTLAESVGLGEPSTSGDTAIAERALTEAGADGLTARLPDGVQTQLGVAFGGVDLSEGQWQKVALARACVRTAPLLLVLDEPTASLDAPSEHEIFQSHARRARDIARRCGGITVIVSHRFSTISMADHIVVMRAGEVVEQGDHDALISSGGLYAELYGLQERAYTRQ